MDKGQKQGETQREERIRQIVDVTAALYDRDGYDAVTFSTIGRGLDFSRINLYNYFRGKEDIFLLILRPSLTLYETVYTIRYYLSSLFISK